MWDENVFFMVLTKEYFATFTEKTIVDPKTPAQALIGLSRDSREEVDKVVEAGLAGGGVEPRAAQDYGFMYSRDLEDPDGNILEFLYMDPAAAEKGPEVYMAEQGTGVDVASRSYGQYCGVTTAVELVGERWAMLIVRDLLVGPRRYTDLKQGLPKIPTNILSARLKELQEGGVVRRVPLTNCGLVYELTDYGRELEPIVLALGRWGFAQMGEPGPDDVVTADSLTMALRTAFRPDAAASLPPADYELHVGDVALRVQVDGDELRIAQLAPPAAPPRRGRSLPAGEPELVFAAGPGIRRVISGELTPAEAIDQDVLAVVAGDARCLSASPRHSTSTRGRRRRMTALGIRKDSGHAGRIHIDLFTTLDGVAQAPGGPDEDREGGFPFGGWQAPLIGEVVGRAVGEGIDGTGRPRPRRQDVRHLRAYWPNHTGAAPTTDRPEVQRVPKYVASRGSSTLEWAGTTQLGRMPRPRSPRCAKVTSDIHVIGSVDFVQTLLAAERVRRADAVGLSDRARRRARRSSPTGRPRRPAAARRPWCRRRVRCCCGTVRLARCARVTWAATTAETDPAGSTGSAPEELVRPAGPEQDEADQHEQRPTRCPTRPAPAGRRPRPPRRSGSARRRS